MHKNKYMHLCKITQNNFAVKNQSAFLWVDFYESYELYQKIKEK
mgnify:CR=1 FL=1